MALLRELNSDTDCCSLVVCPVPVETEPTNVSPTSTNGAGSVCKRRASAVRDASTSSCFTFFEVGAVFRRFLGRPTGRFALGAGFEGGTGAEVLASFGNP